MILQNKVHQTVMEISLSAIAHNLNEYRRLLKPDTKIMAMVKALGYGSGSIEVSRVLQREQVDYLAVAYADEGVLLREAGITKPILVLNIDDAAFEDVTTNNLEPGVFSFGVLKAFIHFLQEHGISDLYQYPIHLKLDTGMHRLGFEEKDIDALIEILLEHKDRIRIKSVFSHLASSDDPTDDTFTYNQAQTLLKCCEKIEKAIGYAFIRHASNSAAIMRLPELQFDMVRLGIGLYGVDSSNTNQSSLQVVSTFRTTIAQIRSVRAGDSIGYNRKGKVLRDSAIATIRIGYADGFNRKSGNGNGEVWINGCRAPIIGNVCMDMTMVDITDIAGVKENDSVEIFGKNIPVTEVAKRTGTIAYEVFTSVGQRIPRTYI